MTPQRAYIAPALGAILLLVVSYALELDVALGLGAGHATGRIAWLGERSGKHAFGYSRGKGSWPILVVANDYGTPIRYFHSFAPGVYRQLYDLIQSRDMAEAPLPGVSIDRVSLSGRNIVTQQRGPASHLALVKLRYAGLGRKCVYSFEEISSPP